ncbi:transporter substrate-binding domain-containing protein [Pontiellaceae bacterium B1224]|nr:transporter substrate-binding domain-containing protein [Pontiellaceae bacterium B1224]
MKNRESMPESLRSALMKAVLMIAVLPMFSVAAESEYLTEADRVFLAVRGELVVVSQQYYEPFEFERDGELCGINVDLVRWMEQELGLKIRFEKASLLQAQEMLRNGEADIISSMFVSDMIDPEVDFSSIIKVALINLYVRSDSEGIKTIGDLAGRRIAVQQTGFSGSVVRNAEIDCDIFFASSTKECIELVSSGVVDAMVGNDLITQYYLYSNERNDIRVSGTPIAAGRICMAVRDGDTQLLDILNKGILAAKQSGKLQEIEAEWLGFGNEKKPFPLKTFLLVLAASGGLILLVLLWNLALRHKVAEKTRQYSESEERLRQVFENSPEVILLVERDGRIALANQNSTTMFKITMEELLAQSISDLLPTAYQDEMTDRMDTWFSGELCECKSMLNYPDQQSIAIDLVGQMLSLDGREVLQLHIRDITLRHEAEEKMAAAQKMIEESNILAERAREIAENSSQVKSEFLVNLSRDIRTPLNDIIGMGQILADNPGESEQESCVSIIQQSSDGLLKTINKVLEIAKIESGALKVQINNFDVRPFLSVIRQRFREPAEKAGIQFTCTCADEVPLYLVGDSGLLDNVLSDLISDALKYTSHGSIALKVECLAKSPEGAELSFKVSDTGVGISQEKQAMIFETPSSIGGSMDRFPSGRGLGLSICKRQVELMGGSIGIDSDEGMGSTIYFSLCLPLANSATAVGRSDGSKEKNSLKPGVSVLLVEDNKVNQKVVSTLLTKAGCTVETADNGRDAVLALHDQPFDVVLMDCLMPVMDGFEATRKIRGLSGVAAKVPIIAITASAMKEDQQACLDCGMNDYIAKPVNRSLLIQTIHKYVGQDDLASLC